MARKIRNELFGFRAFIVIGDREWPNADPIESQVLFKAIIGPGGVEKLGVFTIIYISNSGRVH